MRAEVGCRTRPGRWRPWYRGQPRRILFRSGPSLRGPCDHAPHFNAAAAGCRFGRSYQWSEPGSCCSPTVRRAGRTRTRSSRGATGRGSTTWGWVTGVIFDVLLASAQRRTNVVRTSSNDVSVAGSSPPSSSRRTTNGPSPNAGSSPKSTNPPVSISSCPQVEYEYERGRDPGLPERLRVHQARLVGTVAQWDDRAEAAIAAGRLVAPHRR